MKNKSYLTLTYIVSRIVEKLYRFFFPTLPWLSPEVNKYLIKNVKPSWTGFEYGAGRSTIWFAKRGATLTSVEHNPFWFNKIRQTISENNYSNVNLVLIEREEDKEPQGVQSNYASYIQRTPDESLDFVLIDGVYRAECCKNALQKLKPGGLLIIDDVHRYLPSDSHAPFARRFVDGPESESWSLILKTITDWVCIWTSNGVSATAIYIKPI